MLNLNTYIVRAKYIKTNRYRKIKIISLNKQDVIKELIASGYKEPFDIILFDYNPPTEKQLALCEQYGIILSDNDTSEDVSELLSSYFEHDTKSPSEGLKEFATNHKIIFSSYIGKKRLYDKVFYKLNIENKIAFFIFSIYRYITDDRESNLDTHPHKNIFYEFAQDQLNNDTFIQSLKTYKGRDLRFFGKISFSDDPYKNYIGGNITTYAFKTAHEYLINVGMISGLESIDKMIKSSNDINHSNSSKLISADELQKETKTSNSTSNISFYFTQIILLIIFTILTINFGPLFIFVYALIFCLICKYYIEK